MRILSKFKDFYDWSEFTSYDKYDVVYDRNFKHKKLSLSGVPNGVIIFFIGNISIIFKSKSHLYSKPYKKFIDSFGGESKFLEYYKASSSIKDIEYLFTHDSQPEYDTENNHGEYDKSVFDGKICLSLALRDWLIFECKGSNFYGSKVEVHTNPTLRNKVGTKAPVSILFNIGYGRTQHLYEDFSFMNSGIDLSGISNLNIAGEIDNFVSTMYDVPTVEIDNYSKITSKGFDNKISFRRRN